MGRGHLSIYTLLPRHYILVGTLRNEDESKDDGSGEKYYFSFNFSVLDHRQIFPFDFA